RRQCQTYAECGPIAPFWIDPDPGRLEASSNSRRGSCPAAGTTSTTARAPTATTSARVSGEHALHAGRVIDREHAGHEAARRAPHRDERDAGRRDDGAVDPRLDVGGPVALVAGARLHRGARAAHH